MANTKITNAEVLTIAKNMIEKYGPDDFITDNNHYTNNEVIEKINHMIEITTKKRTKTTEKTSSKAIENLAFAKMIYSIIDDDTTYAVKEILEKLGGANDSYNFEDYTIKLNTSKLSAIMKEGVKNELFTTVKNYKIENKGRPVMGYRINIKE